MFKKKKNTRSHSNILKITTSPKSRFSESIKNIRTNLQFSAVDKDIQVILISSPAPSNGKSFISANLAVAYSQDNKKVLIIDSDLRKGRQNEIFQVRNSITGGYSNLILNYEDLKEKKDKESKDEKEFDINNYISKTKIFNVDLITTGPTPPNPVELLGSYNNGKVLSYLKKKYDVIILDCPPIIGLSDALVMTKYSDANLLIVESNKTKEADLEMSIRSFQQVGAKITGVIINKVALKNDNYSSYYGYYGYYGE